VTKADSLLDVVCRFHYVAIMPEIPANPVINAGLVGFGMIVDETYRPCLDALARSPLFLPASGSVGVRLAAAATRTGIRVERFLRESGSPHVGFANLVGDDAAEQLARLPVQAVCVATPDGRHFAAALAALAAGKHTLIEKPSVLALSELDDLIATAARTGALAKVVYHKLADPDHKKLRTLYQDGVLRHVNNGYCSLLEPKSISGGQFAEWVRGRNPSTYVAVHYLKLIDFTFGPDWALDRVSASGQRGLVGPADGPTWDSVQLQVVYRHPDAREAAFDIHTSWVTPDNFPGYVEQEVQFRFDNAVWAAHQRKRGVELTVEGRTPHDLKNTPNYHYNGTFLEPWGERSQRGYGIEVIERFFREVATVEFGGPADERPKRLTAMRALAYNDLAADRNVVAVVQASEAILKHAAAGRPGCVVKVNQPEGGLVLYAPGTATPEILYPGRV
jgi:predicted dehydrogenase